MLYCDNCGEEFEESRVKVEHGFIYHGELDYNNKEAYVDYVCPLCGSSDVTDLDDEYILPVTPGERREREALIDKLKRERSKRGEGASELPQG